MAQAAADAALASEKRERVERQRAENALYLSDIRLAAAYLQAERHADAQERLLQHVPDSTQNDRRGWEWYHLTGQSDPSLVRWNTNSRNVQAITWSPDGKQLAAAQWGGPSAMIWDAADGSDDRSLIGGKTLTLGIDWHPKTNQVAWGCAANDFQLRILDLNDNSMTLLKENTGSHRCVRWSPDGKRIALGGIFEGDSDKTVVIWENQNGKWQTLSKVRTEGGSGVDGVAWSPSGTELLVVGRYSDSWVMNPENLKVLRKTSEYGICSAGWHPTLPLIVCGLRSGEICILNSETMEVQKRVNAHLGEITSIAWSADGTFLASGSADQSVKIWDGATLEAISSFVGHRGIVNEVRWSPDGTRLASCGFDGRISIWPRQPEVSSIMIEVEKNLENRSIRNRRRFAWLDNDTIRASISDREIVHRDAKTGQVKSKIDLKGGGWQVLASNQIYRFFDSDAIQITTDAKDATSEAVVRPTRNLWTNLYSDKWVAYCEQPPESYSADGPFYAQNLETHQRIRLGEQSFTMVGEVQWSPDQKWIAVVGGGVISDGGNLRHAGWVNLCDAKTGKTSHRVRIGEQRVTGLSVAWRPDSKCLVAGNRDGLCQVYEMPNLKTKFSKRVHRLAVQSLSWHPTQERIASGSLDRTVSIWDPNTGDVFVTFTLDAPVEHVSWSPNGVRVAAMDVNGQIHVWTAGDAVDLLNFVFNQTSP